ncbi:hypothetical protein CTAM01_17297 [Colletotrichum tamarilloi]|uniref:Transposase n=1 Tax=Colletotrichum tamarilloi TaxID=1209934 RepID=A0ABQ9QG10_9PEZI|nr:uncharacterized protein CTAM01_17297 [Colletotrichum tamarilloi]KAK1451214.1 hypothetical protein CTAM01_17297 [Colletotrichum tamarilloi]
MACLGQKNPNASTLADEIKAIVKGIFPWLKSICVLTVDNARTGGLGRDEPPWWKLQGPAPAGLTPKFMSSDFP